MYSVEPKDFNQELGDMNQIVYTITHPGVKCKLKGYKGVDGPPILWKYTIKRVRNLIIPQEFAKLLLT